MLNYIGVGERAGSGVPSIYAIWEQEGYVEPTVDELSGREETITTVVTLPLVKKNQAVLGPGPEKGPEKGPENKADEMSARCEAILIEMKENPKVSRPML